MSELRQEQAVQCGDWPTAAEANLIYKMNTKSAAVAEQTIAARDALKKFAAACIATNRPLEKLNGAGAENERWAEVLQSAKGLSVNVISASGKDWGKKGLWFTEFKAEWEVEDRTLDGLYVEEVDDVNGRWRGIEMEREHNLHFEALSYCNGDDDDGYY